MFKKVKFALWYAKSVSETTFIEHYKKEIPGIEDHVDLKAEYAKLTGKTAEKPKQSPQKETSKSDEKAE